MFLLKSLPAYDGDCFIIKFGEGENIKNIIVDGGRRKKVINKLKEELQKIKQEGQYVDLMILTHIDEDHIQGLLKIFEDNEVDKTIIKKVWFNSKELLSNHFLGTEQEDNKLKIYCKENDNVSFTQGVSFGKALELMGLSSSELIYTGQELKIGDAILKVLSPNIQELERLFKKWDKVFPANLNNGTPISRKEKKDHNESIDELLKSKFIEDKAEANGSSIAFSIEIKGKRLLMLGDSFPSVVSEGLKKSYNENYSILFDFIKISHHGSKHNTSDEFLNLINCNHYLISTNGHTHDFPDKETLVRIATSSKKENINTKFYFNYPDIHEKIFNEEEKEYLSVECIDMKYIKDEVLEVDLWNYLEN